ATIWWLDRYDREPIWLLGLTFLWGAIGSVLAAVLGSILIDGVIHLTMELGSTIDLDLSTARAISGPVLVAPLVEEPAKAVVLLYVIWNRHFDNMTDGFVYGAAAGLGFGMTENLMYFVSVSSDVAAWGSTVLIRTFYSAVMHATASAILGASLGFARFRGSLVLTSSGVAGMGLAMLVHALWNGLITFSELTGGEGLFFANLIIFPLEVSMVFIVFQICLLEESWTIERELIEEARDGRLPEAHPKILASWLQRLSTRWVPEGVDHDLYVQTATSLAMRKKQVRQMGAHTPSFYRDEVDRLRRQLELVLKGRWS
ncbi:MAG TPA: PrsW family intramembrane metalloprotease, partial [Deltaproteobacteria bacterium]|nr:PrsW family intramembrane metalloprotease [Deltaproteobacteria bacterium]